MGIDFLWFFGFASFFSLLVERVKVAESSYRNGDVGESTDESFLPCCSIKSSSIASILLCFTA